MMYIKKRGFTWFCRILLYGTVVLGVTINSILAGTTGKLAGRVFDDQNELLIGANIILTNTQLGAATDADGFYYIINLPPGHYTIEFSYVGYKTRLVQNVEINADRTTNLDVQLEVAALEGETVTVIAERPVVDLNVTGAMASVSSEEIESIPVMRLDEIVGLQAGVVDGHFRGGRLGEVQYQINGVSVNNSYNNSVSLQLDRSVLQEVQIISGTFDAEYGQAMSGVVNVVLKSGSDKYAWSGEAYLGDYFYSSGDRRNQTDEFRPLSVQNYKFSLSGPTYIFPRTNFIVSLRQYIDNGYIYGTRQFVPTDSSDFEQKIFNPTGDNKEKALSYSDEITGLFKLTNSSFNTIKIEYQAIFNQINGRRYNYGFRLNPDGMSEQETFSIVHGLDWSHTLSARTFYTINVRQNYFNYSDYKYKDVYDNRYDLAGPPIGDSEYELGAVVQGVDLTRFEQSTNTVIVKGALTSQVTRTHLVKLGAEVQISKLEFGTPGYIVNPGGTLLVRHVNEPPDYPAVQVYDPISVVAYAQDQIEWQDFVFRAGLRWEYFNARDSIPSDLQNPANAISGAPASYPEATSAKAYWAPRIGVSYPITSTSSMFFAYGHFYQMPPLGQIFSNADYMVLDELQAGGISYGVLGNPDLKPEMTVTYEFGYKNALTPSIGLSFNVFYKDIRDLLGVEFISTYAAAEYARLTNVDFGNILGFTLALDQRRWGPITTAIDYTYQQAMGNSSDPRETATRASAGEDPRPRLIPLNWDQRHTLNATLVYEIPENFLASSIIRFGTGQPYTPTIKSGFGGGLESNSGTKDTFIRVDLLAEKYFKLSGIGMSVFLRVMNLLDARFMNGFVFNDTGSPDYSLDPIGQRATLADPNRYYPPRRIELGITLKSE